MRSGVEERKGFSRAPVRALERGLSLAGAATLLSVAYLLILTLAAAVGRRRPRPPARGAAATRFLILVPAHDEEITLGATLRAVSALDYPTALRRVVVIADHCQDATPEIAAAHGVEVLERRDGARGKGAALAWALAMVGRQPGDDHHAVLFLDADCIPSPNLLVAADRRLREGAQVVQSDYVVSNPAQSRASALRFASFALINTIRPWGKDVLGLSCGILGTGFAVSRELLDRHGWSAFSLTEDTEFHLQLLDAGVCVRFLPEAQVASAMPASWRAAEAQNTRWESGKLAMIGVWAPRLVRAGMRRRDPRLLHAALDGVIPPQSALAASGLVIAAAGAMLGAPRLARRGVACLLGQALHVVAGLWLARAPAGVYRSLAFAPWLVAWKLVIYARLLRSRGPTRWERTER